MEFGISFGVVFEGILYAVRGDTTGNQVLRVDDTDEVHLEDVVDFLLLVDAKDFPLI